MVLTEHENRQFIVRVFSKRFGITPQPDTVSYLSDLFASVGMEAEEVTESVTTILNMLLKQSNDVTQIDRKTLEVVVKRLMDRHEDDEIHDRELYGKQIVNTPSSMISISNLVRKAQNFLHVLSAFDAPRFRYDRQHHVFLPHNRPKLLMGTAEDKVDVFRFRYDMLKQRILRNDNFKPPAFARETSTREYFKITSIKNLLGCEGQTFLLFGMLSEAKPGQYMLEDLDAEVELVLDHAASGLGIYTETCFVLVSGIFLENKRFQVQEIGMPPPEERHQSIVANKMVDFFGGPHMEPTMEMQRIESDENIIFIILSDVWLDQPRVLDRLRKLFEGYMTTEWIPAAFILMGDFVSEPFTYNGVMFQKYKDAFEAFMDLLNDFPVISNVSRFILVPGPNDPWGGHVLPKPNLPKTMLERILLAYPNITLATNPCRIKYCSQEIVVFREDVLAKMQRHAVLKPQLEDEPLLYRHLIFTLLNQSYLCPLPLDLSPVYWCHDQALQLYPNPHVLILGDRQDPFEAKYAQCLCIHPGPFAVTNYQFMVYHPHEHKADLSQIE